MLRPPDNVNPPSVVRPNSKNAAVNISAAPKRLKLPLYDLPPTGPRPYLDPSVVAQIHGLMHCLYGIGIERT